MFPWLLCLLSSTTIQPLEKTLIDSESVNSLWWNPAESSSSREFGGYKIYQGDILMPAESDRNLKNAIKWENFLWDDGIIPYEFGDNFTSSEKSLIMDAMDVLQNRTCIKFVKKDHQDTFIWFQKEKKGCFAPIGRLPGNDGPLPVNLQSPECFKEVGIVEHELLHVIGLFHEQSRPDRDDYVTIHWCNIERNHEVDFLRGTNLLMNTFGVPYDFLSIMHYPKWAFSRNGQPTITAKADPKMTLGQRKNPSDSDFQKVIKMYQCETKEDFSGQS